MITLFSESSDSMRRPAALALSAVLHIFVAWILWFGITYVPPIRGISADRYALRQLDLRTPDEQSRAAKDPIPYPTSSFSAPSTSGAPSAPDRSPVKISRPAPVPAVSAPEQASSAPPPPHIDQIKPGPQTLIQPDLQTSVTLKENIPVPQVMIWSPSREPVTKISPPLSEKPATADVKPTLAKPNQELASGDVNLASSTHPAPAQPVLASSTSPIASPNKQQVQPPAVSTPQATAHPAPAAILSVSDLHAESSTTILPPVNEAVASKAQTPPTAGQNKNSAGISGTSASSATSGLGNHLPASANSSSPSTGSRSAVKPPQTAASATAGTPGTGIPQKLAANGSSNSSPATVAKPETEHSASGLQTALNALGQPAITQIALPKDGHFGAVVVGNSLEDQFPEISGVWQGRIAYTAYLHVGLAKSWILQYSLPRSAEASSSGTVAHLDAPWPYNIVRPNLVPGSVDADALMIHGFVNQSGRFEMLNVVFPEAFPQAQFVIGALQQWVFRPALQDGQPARIEVLLIIPTQYE